MRISATGKLETDKDATARIAIRRTGGSSIRLYVSGWDTDAAPVIRQFVEALSGRPFDPHSADHPTFHKPIRLESVGLDDQDRVESVVFEADLRTTVLVVATAHQRRAAEFCRRHRHFTTSEAMDDLAAEFERVGRDEYKRGRAAALQRAGDWCLEQAIAEKGSEPKPDTEEVRPT